VISLIRELSAWITTHGRRHEVGRVVEQYFEDMFCTFQAQLRALRRGGTAVCVVANSTYSRRDRAADGTVREAWRLPILTDVFLAHLALLAGFDDVELWHARDLRPRNVTRAVARESLVVARKG
jgi:hypothetical protein